ncbi:hypothetical protein LIER_01491 [Lithospermum erythrorhizon]|uniref:DYW domain-containing protein n=1 Tax=Lithospermum erythrorhizon TaxID=34254 RepID=A0AAV3NMA0_LITER
MLESHLLHHLQQCIKRRTPSQAKALHASILKTASNQLNSPLIYNTLLNTYAKCGLLEDTSKVFDEMPQRDLFSWASIFTSYNQSNLPRTTISQFRYMLAVDKLRPDHFIFACITKACASLGYVRVGKQVHGQFVVSVYSDDDVSKSALVDMYAKCGEPGSARVVFHSIREKSSVSLSAMVSAYARVGMKSEATELMKVFGDLDLYCWTALVSGLVQRGHCVDAFQLFTEMRREGVEIIDGHIISSLLGASSSLAMLELGKQLHSLVIGLGFVDSLFLCNALVDMYAKCSDVFAAKTVFYGMWRRDVVSWTSIIFGMAQHGQAFEALCLYDEMISAGIKPNEVTFIGLLYACSHVGLIDKGRKLFNSMVEEFGLKPSLQHYTCLLDLYSRSGQLDKAENLIKSMPFKPDVAAWAALLSACKQHGNAKMGVRVANHLLNLGPGDTSTCILLSNTYAGAGEWESVSKIRKLMVAMDLKKEPGYSCIDLGKERIVFYVGEVSHPMKNEIFMLLKEMEIDMRKQGYVPDTSSVLHDMDQQEKEKQLFWHSERVAVAYGLLKSVPGTVLRIVKNLRVCGDCHTFMKLVSSISKRGIVVRDSSRFHHFKDGNCSCNDFW